MTLNNSKLPLGILTLISVILLAVLILGAYNIQLKNKEASELLNLADEASEARTLAQSILMAQNNAAEDLAAFDSLTLADDKLVSLIDSIEGAGRTLGLDTNIVSVGKIEDQESVEPDMIRVMMETEGPWAQTLSFLHAIESLPHRVMIEESSLSRVEVGWYSKIIFSLYSFD